MARVSTAHLEARRRSILDAATAVFSRKGVKSATMAEIARQAGISPGAIYCYFESKQELAHECFHDNIEGFADQWRRQARESKDPLAAILALSLHTFEHLLDAQAQADTIMHLENVLDAVRSGDEEQLQPLRKEEHEIVRGLSDALAEAQRAGQLPTGLDADRFAEALVSFWWGARITRLFDPSTDPLEQAKQMGLVMGWKRPAMGDREEG